MSGAVEISAQGWGWRDPSRRAWAVRGLDLDVAAGERVLVLGASGSGKSTLLAGLAGLLDPGAPGRILLMSIVVETSFAEISRMTLEEPRNRTCTALVVSPEISN